MRRYAIFAVLVKVRVFAIICVVGFDGLVVPEMHTHEAPTNDPLSPSK